MTKNEQTTKSRPRRHQPHPDGSARDSVALSLCGIPGSDLASHPSEVTCRLCLRQQRQARAKTSSCEIEGILRTILEAPSIPPTPWDEGLPLLTPVTWRHRDCTCGSCAVCRYFRALELEGLAEPAARTVAREYRWGSVTHALKSYAHHIVEGPDGPKSALGAFEDLARLGTFVDRSKTDSVRRSHYDAHEAGLIERILESALGGEAVGFRKALAILLAHEVGVPHARKGQRGAKTEWISVSEAELAERAGTTEAVIHGLIVRARRALKIELAARGFIPPPRESERAYAAFLVRFDDVESRRVA
jgi:hypothetical protein